MQRVFVLDINKRPLAPCRPSRARKLLNAGKAAVFKRYPFTIILKHAVAEADPKPLRLKIDPGSRITGLAVVNDQSGEVVFAAELKHRGYLIKKRLYNRRAARRSRRRRHTRFRKPRFLNRRRPKGWLPPSLQHRVLTIQTWVGRLQALCNIQNLSQELVRFDTQLMENPWGHPSAFNAGSISGSAFRGGVEVAPGKYRFFEKRIMEKIDAEQNPQMRERPLQREGNCQRKKEGEALPGLEQGFAKRGRSLGRRNKRGAVSRIPDEHGIFGSG